MEVLKESQYLRHEKYGLGTVSKSNPDRTTIDFYDHGVKKFATELLVADLLPGKAPARPAPPGKRTKKAAARKAATPS
jgi:hypothetical protein